MMPPFAMRPLVMCLALAALAGCGAKRDLKWPQGEEPPQPAAAPAPRTFEQMMTPPAGASPDRVNEPLLKSQPRPDDPFDLPPPG